MPGLETKTDKGRIGIPCASARVEARQSHRQIAQLTDVLQALRWLLAEFGLGYFPARPRSRHFRKHSAAPFWLPLRVRLSALLRGRRLDHTIITIGTSLAKLEANAY